MNPLKLRCVPALPVILLLVGALPAHAQDPGETCLNPAVADTAAERLSGSALLRLYPDSASRVLGALMSDSQWVGAIDSVRLWFDRAAPNGTDKSNMQHELSALRTMVAGVRRNQLRDATDAMSDRLDYAPVQLDDGVALFPTKATRIDVTDAMPLDVQRAFCWAGLSAVIVLDDFRKTEFAALRERVGTALERWTAYNEDGRSQYPWELFVNGLAIDKLSLDPPRMQWILFHPWVGLQAIAENGDWNANSVSRATVVPVDLAGFIRYSADFSSYWGLSATASLSETRTRGGVALHLGKGISFGPMFSDGDGFDGFLFTVDFMKRLAGIPYVQQYAEERLGGALEEREQE